MRHLRYTSVLCALCFVAGSISGCKDLINPDSSHLLPSPLQAVFAGHDSANVDVYANPVFIRMSDHSRFPLVVTELAGDTQAFVYSLDTHDTDLHTLSFTPTSYAFTHAMADSVAVVTLTVAVPTSDGPAYSRDVAASVVVRR